MSYLVLARKSRPQSFDQVVGQKSIVKTLRNSLKRDRVAHAILFSGVRGVGKTTLARIMAKAINCEATETDKPCNTCKTCLNITSGSSLDLYEIDGASNRGIQEIRELKEKIKFLPTSSKFKIIIIDEVHMLTTEAFNALLKTLEEPPKHVHFMFATTELHKIPITILSRCQRYELKRIPSKDLFTHFNNLATNENITIDEKALQLIVRESDGSVRDGLSLLDQVFSYCDSHVSLEDVSEVLGLVNRDVLLDLASGLLDGDRSKALLALNQVFTFGMDLKRFSADLLDCFRTLILCKIKGCDALLDLPDQELVTYNDLADKYSTETLHLKLTLLMQAVEDIRYSSQPRLSFETSFLKIIEAGNVVSIPSLIEKLDSHLSNIQSGNSGHSSVAAPSVHKKKTPIDDRARQTVAPPNRAISSQPAASANIAAINIEQKPYVVSNEIQPPPIEDSHNPMERRATHTSQTRAQPHPHQRDVRKDWMAFTEYVKERKLWMSKDLLRADSAKQIDNELHLQYLDQANCTLLQQTDHHRELTEFVLDFFQKQLIVKFIVPDHDEQGSADGSESPNKLRQQLSNDPLVIMATETFNGQVGDIRVGPRSR